MADESLEHRIAKLSQANTALKAMLREANTRYQNLYNRYCAKPKAVHERLVPLGVLCLSSTIVNLLTTALLLIVIGGYL